MTDSKEIWKIKDMKNHKGMTKTSQDRRMNKKRPRLTGLFLVGLGALLFSVFFVSRLTYASWVEEEDGIKYLREDGQYAVGFEDIEDKRYYFDADGHLVTGKFYVEEEDAYYYSDETGALQYGVIQTEQYFFITDETGRLRTGFVEHNEKQYYFNEIGEVVTGWFSYESDWYYADYAGVLQKGFVTVDGYRYYLDETGKRVDSTVLEIDGVTYMFNQDGSVDENATMLYPVLVFFNENRKKENVSPLISNPQLTSCAIMRAAQLVNGFTLDLSIEEILTNQNVSCKKGYELAYGGIQDYNVDVLLEHIKMDENLLEILKKDQITDVGIGVYEKDNIYYYSVIFTEGLVTD